VDCSSVRKISTSNFVVKLKEILVVLNEKIFLPVLIVCTIFGKERFHYPDITVDQIRSYAELINQDKSFNQKKLLDSSDVSLGLFKYDILCYEKKGRKWIKCDLNSNRKSIILLYRQIYEEGEVVDSSCLKKQAPVNEKGCFVIQLNLKTPRYKRYFYGEWPNGDL
jgi:hypothetical protein